MITLDQMKESMKVGAIVLSEDGAVLGPIGQFYVDDATGQPSWVTVITHTPGNPESFAPLQGATFRGKDIRLPYPHALVYESPKMPQDGHLSPEAEQHLLHYYGLVGPNKDTAEESVDPVNAGAARNAAPARSRSSQTEGDDYAVTRSEEQLRVGTELRETERVRLVKRVVTEDVTVTVQIRREELLVERIPVSDGAALYDDGDKKLSRAERKRLYSAVGTAFSGDVIELVLYEERPRVEIDVVPIERVRLSRDTHTDDEVVHSQVRKEVIETERVDL